MPIRISAICVLLIATNAALPAQIVTTPDSHIADSPGHGNELAVEQNVCRSTSEASYAAAAATNINSPHWATPLRITEPAARAPINLSWQNTSSLPAVQPMACCPEYCRPPWIAPNYLSSDCFCPPWRFTRSSPQVRFGPYGWLSEIHGAATFSGVTNDINVGTSDLFDFVDLVDRAFFGRLEIDNGSHAILLDSYWVGLGLDDEIAGFDFSAQFELAIAELAFAHTVEGLPELLALPPHSRMEILAGARYWMLDTAGTITAPGGIFSVRFDGKHDWVDPILGARMTAPLDRRTTVQIRGDIGGFGLGTASDFTWSAEAILECHWSDRCSTLIGYRILDVDNHRGSGFQEFGWDMQFRGPIFQLTFKL